MTRALPVLAMPSTLPLAACSSVVETVKGPQMSAMAYPSALVPSKQVVLEPRPTARVPTSANSLWRNGSRTFFHDQRASHVGDILTVLITINDSAQTQNETVANRTSSDQLGLTNLFGLESTLGRLLAQGLYALHGAQHQFRRGVGRQGLDQPL